MFNKIVKEGKKCIDLRAIKKKLRKKGINKQDIKTSIELMSCIAYFDNILFEKRAMLFFVYGKQEEVAGFKEDQEIYYVVSRGISRRIKERSKIILFKEDGSSFNYQDLPNISREQYLINIASHEVRHRMQKTNIKMFFEEIHSKKINSYINFFKLEIKKKYSNDIEKIKAEIDARVIGELVLCVLHKKCVLTKITDIIKLNY